MAYRDLVPAIVLSLGAAAAGGPDALHMLLGFAGKTPLVDIAICFFLVGAATASVLGTMLLARYFRVARNAAGAGGAAPPTLATECFAKIIVTVALAVIFLVTACLLVVPFAVAGGDLDGANYSCSA